MSLQRHDTAGMNSSPHRPERISVVLGEHFPLVRRGIAGVFKDEGDILLAAAVANGDAALDAIRAHRPSVAILGLNLPGKGALEALAALAAEGLHVRVVILAPHMSHDELAQAKHAGAHGIAYCDMPASTLVRCVRVVHAGGEFLQGREQERQLAKVSGQFRLQRAFAPSLTARENSVAEHVKIGLSNKEIARALGLTEGTVKSHLHRVYDKLHVHGRYALMKSGWEDATPGTEQVARSP